MAEGTLGGGALNPTGTTNSQQLGGGMPIQGLGANNQSQGFQYSLAPSGNVNQQYINAAQMPVSSIQQGAPYMQKMQDAYLNQANARLDPQWSQRQGDMDANLANMGLSRGSNAWNREQQNFQFGRNDAYSTAQNNAILNSGAEAARLQGMDINAGNFANTAAQQNYQNQLTSQQAQNAAQGQNFGQNLQAGQFANAGNTAQQNAAQGWGQIEASKYGSDQSLAGTKYSADQGLAGSLAHAGAANNASNNSFILGSRAEDRYSSQQQYDNSRNAYFDPLHAQNLLSQGGNPANPTFGNGPQANQPGAPNANYAAGLGQGSNQLWSGVGTAAGQIANGGFTNPFATPTQSSGGYFGGVSLGGGG